MIIFKKINAAEVRKKTLLNYLEDNYSVLNKQQIYKIAIQYIEAVYLRNGNLHVIATNEMLKNLEKGE